MFFWLWLKRVLLTSRNIFQFSTLFSLLSLILGVASLTIAMLVINGFSSGLERAIVDMSGHVIVQSEKNQTRQDMLEDLSSYKSHIKNQMTFLSSEGLVLNKKKFKSVFIEGLEDRQFSHSSLMKKRIVEGNIKISENFLIVGKSLAQELDLKIGSSVPIIISNTSDSYLSRKQKVFTVGAIGDFGRYELNSRYVLMPLSSLQSLGKKSNEISGVRLWLKQGAEAEYLAYLMRKELGEDYNIFSWKDTNRNFFEVIEMDKRIIFIVLLILIFAAGFNVSSSLFVQVFKKTKDISILKAMGASQTLVRNLFLLNGLVLGIVGIGLGYLLGWVICYELMLLQEIWNFIPEEIYQVNKIVLEWKNQDFLIIFISSLIVVLLSSLLPAKRAYQLNVKEGLSYN